MQNTLAFDVEDHFNLTKTEERLRSLLEHFEFGPMGEVFACRFGES